MSSLLFTNGRIGNANGALTMPKETDPSLVLSEMALREVILTLARGELITCLSLPREGHGLYLPDVAPR